MSLHSTGAGRAARPRTSTGQNVRLYSIRKALPTIYTLRTRKIGELGEHEKLNRVSAPVQRASKKGTFLSAGSKK